MPSNGPYANQGATVWGTIVGTLSDQPDLQNALDGKLDDGSSVDLQASTPGTAQTGHENISGTIIAGGFSGPLTGAVTGNVTGSLIFDPAPANLAYNGEFWTATAGEALTIGQVCYMGPDGKWWKATGNLPSVWVANTAYAIGAVIKPTATQNYFYFCTTAGTSAAVTEPTWGTTIGGTTADGTGALVWTCCDTESFAGRMMATTTINANAAGIFLKKGFIRYDAGATLVLGQDLFLDATTAGADTHVRPAASGNRVQILGRAGSTTKTRFFDPNTVIAQVP